MWQQALTLPPVYLIRFGKRCIKHLKHSLFPLYLLSFRHGVQENRLYQPVERERVLLRLAGEQGIGTERRDYLIPLQFIVTNGFEGRSQVLASLAKEFFRNGIWLQERADS